MRLAFAGTPPFAATALSALLGAGHDVRLVVTRPERPAGRGMRASPSAVAELARQAGLAVATPESLSDDSAVAQIRSALPEAIVVAAYGKILPEALLRLPPRGCLNIHASLLPRWRGAAPVQRAILAGDVSTGISIMVMEAGLDTGPVLLRRDTPILPDESAGSLTDRLARLGGALIVEALARLDQLTPEPQPTQGITYATKVSRAESRLDWAGEAQSLARQVRAFDPYPGSDVVYGGERLKVWRAQPVADGGEPGVVVGERDGCPVVACGRGALVLVELQRPGGRRLPASELTRGYPISSGSSFS